MTTEERPEPAPTMGLRAVDARFLLPRMPETAATPLPDWQEGLRRAGVRLVDPGSGDRPDLVVAQSSDREAADRTGASMLLLIGRPGLRPALLPNRGSRQYLPLPDPTAPTVLLDLTDRRAAAAGAGTGLVPGGRRGVFKHRVGRGLLRVGLFPPVRTVYTVRAPSTIPAIVERSREVTGFAPNGWFLKTEPDEWRRCVFYVYRATSRHPDAVIKFSRRRGDTGKSAREVTGLHILASGPQVAQERSPRLLGSFDIDGYHADVQTAVRGKTLTRVLDSPGSRAGKVGHLEAVHRWLCDVARASATRRTAAPENLRTAATPQQGHPNTRADLTAVLAAAPSVFMHGDLSDGNVMIGKEFSIIDWEYAEPHGLPLWDQLKLALYSLPLLDGAHSEAQHTDHLTALFRGQLPGSDLLFRWLRDLALASGVRPDQVPALISLGLRYRLARRMARRLAETEGDLGSWAPVDKFTEIWFSAPDLGLDWSAWQARTGGLSPSEGASSRG
jgi:hypothetical protein